MHLPDARSNVPLDRRRKADVVADDDVMKAPRKKPRQTIERPASTTNRQPLTAPKRLRTLPRTGGPTEPAQKRARVMSKQVYLRGPERQFALQHVQTRSCANTFAGKIAAYNVFGI
ncbi:hypothetical protein ACHHYP_20009 [Achlya hypogyna]|uniref:Uncharacterized protein n=1 Tax=Achlya hypogyna TaxID=1202772 RepID=A0A1V9ZBM7_ACHHY|nr:hypothetical protein ACHHYP_20009 [Achlya hypogyna]